MECAEIFEADQGMQKKKVFNLQSLLGMVLLHKYCNTEVQEEQIIGKSKSKYLDHF